MRRWLLDADSNTTLVVPTTEPPPVATSNEAGSSPSQGSSIMLTLCIAGVVWVVVLVALVVFRHKRKQTKLERPMAINIECSTNGTAIMTTLHRFPVHTLPPSERSNPMKRSSLPRLQSYDEPLDYHTVTFIDSPCTDANSSMLNVTYHESIIQSEPSPPLLEELLIEDDDYRSDGEEGSSATFYSLAGKESIDSYADRTGRSWAQSIQSADSQASSSDGYFTMSTTQLPSL
ncbi:hypothetical protein SPRG_13403 [Saprolegnia parasitica CBS 223.65]|uniref:Uncharacterized protein n=1 Tax=Saprolegnia parasitica (strain CBS 223.65) TaxID=695850 RepID=A0A067BUZ8_SAPPC|nr:hypothetical protein SPRG_13403 [Saprolegnia parasitica CBS 223.65]KDO20650.1 hypothetical protein SPRG_13403 [Saprolegnia parasitica CBS 223.65]|eukprot:XP_012208616.1 hypothetical protein SPRG_13403 [Saprolegnia parasitica CBS 223.65]